jgi:GT2 family glycosyltransferase
MKSTPRAPWWFIPNHDVEFAEGDLQRLIDHMQHDQNSLVMLNWMSAIGMTRHVLREVGWFDENFVPAYYEDNDYLWRCKLAGVSVVNIPSGYFHDGSSTIKSNSVYATRNMKSFPSNGEYYRAKWGGYPGSEQFERPFNGQGNHRDWTLVPDRLIDLSW